MNRRLKMGFVLMMLVALVISHQNCGKNIEPSRSTARPSDAHKTLSETFLWTIARYDTLSFRANNPSSGPLYIVNLRDGSVVDSHNTPNLCLSIDARESLKRIFEGSYLCPGYEPADSSRQCTLAYTFPYAELRNSVQTNSAFPLGERRSGCSQGPDFCGEAGTMLRDFVHDFNPEAQLQLCE